MIVAASGSFTFLMCHAHAEAWLGSDLGREAVRDHGARCLEVLTTWMRAQERDARGMWNICSVTRSTPTSHAASICPSHGAPIV